jgi:hypothetical protein
MYVLAQVWLSTWKSYRNDEFGFNFSYPANWHIGGTDITKEQLDEKGVIYFWIDQLQSPPDNHYDTFRSQGNVVVSIERLSVPSIHYNKLTTAKFGNKVGYVYEYCNDLNGAYVGILICSKTVKIDSKYALVIDTLTYSKDSTLVSRLVARCYHLVGSLIINSFTFD